MQPIDPPDENHRKGAINELRVVNYFLSRGNQVFMPVVQQGKVDMVVDGADGFMRVQVKTANLNRGHNKFDYIQCRLGSVSYSPESFQVLAVVYEDRLWIIPWSEIAEYSNICLESSNPNYRPRGLDLRKYEVGS